MLPFTYLAHVDCGPTMCGARRALTISRQSADKALLGAGGRPLPGHTEGLLVGKERAHHPILRLRGQTAWR